ncbi:hypothetical protein K438DRAFT_1995635 [Mycena galopus ATCC 62051]|nr:hypothetical protein K438DRAFT_1995635 [Mycena galopus ATCC 62051]
MHRANPEVLVLAYMWYKTDHCDPKATTTSSPNHSPPVYSWLFSPPLLAPSVTAKGDVVYSEFVRENVRKLEAYIKEMASSDTVSGAVHMNNVEKQKDLGGERTCIRNDISTTIGRTSGNTPIMGQKSPLGHSKGRSAIRQMADSSRQSLLVLSEATETATMSIRTSDPADSSCTNPIPFIPMGSVQV